MMRVTRTMAAVFLCIPLVSGIARPASADDSKPQALVTEKLVFHTTDKVEAEMTGVPLQTLHFTLVDQQQQPSGMLDVSLLGTLLPTPANPDEAPRGLVTAVASLAKGQISAQGAWTIDDGDIELAITGGTGAYRKARGYVHVVPKQDDDARVVFHLMP